MVSFCSDEQHYREDFDHDQKFAAGRYLSAGSCGNAAERQCTGTEEGRAGESCSGQTRGTCRKTRATCRSTGATIGCACPSSASGTATSCASAGRTSRARRACSGGTSRPSRACSSSPPVTATSCASAGQPFPRPPRVLRRHVPPQPRVLQQPARHRHQLRERRLYVPRPAARAPGALPAPAARQVEPGAVKQPAQAATPASPCGPQGYAIRRARSIRGANARTITQPATSGARITPTGEPAIAGAAAFAARAKAAGNQSAAPAARGAAHCGPRAAPERRRRA